MLSIEKIGGTSMTRFQDVLRNIVLPKNGQDPYNRIFVVSAYGGVTNWLLENKKTKAPGVYTDFIATNNANKQLGQLEKRLLELNKEFVPIGLNLAQADEFIVKRIRQVKRYLHNIAEIVASGYVDKAAIYLQAREILASIGESHSAFNSANIAAHHGLNTTCVDLSGLHDPEYLTIDQRIEKAFAHIDCSKTIPFVTGYTKGTEGIMRQFDRGYTEVTFAKIAAHLKADEAIIHKEYHFCSADPGIVGEQNAHPVCYTNYDIADQLADIWMEAVHPSVSKILEQAGINLRVKNAFDPEHPGTLISRTYKSESPRIEMISGADNVQVIEIHDPRMVGAVGFDKAIMDIFARHKVNYILKATNANSISVVVRKSSDLSLVNELKDSFFEVSLQDAAIVCVLGTNISGSGILARAATALAREHINIKCLSLSLRQVNIQFVIDPENYQTAIRALNTEFFPPAG